MATIKPRRGTGTPSGLAQNELAIDPTNKRVYLGNAGGTGDIVASHISDYVTSLNGSTGAVVNVARTNEGNTFSVQQILTAGLSASATTNTLNVTATSDGIGLVVAQDSSSSASNSRIGKIKLGRSSTAGQNTILENNVGKFGIYNAGSNLANAVISADTTGITLYGPVIRIASSVTLPETPTTGDLRFLLNDGFGTITSADLLANTTQTANTTHTLPSTTGTLLNTTSSYVSGICGATGAITLLAGSGIGITKSASSFTIRNTGVQSIDGLTGVLTNINAATVGITTSTANATKYLIFAGGAGNTALQIDDSKPLSYNPFTGTIGARQANITDGTYNISIDPSTSWMTINDGLSTSTITPTLVASNVVGPFEIRNTSNGGMYLYSGGAADYFAACKLEGLVDNKYASLDAVDDKTSPTRQSYFRVSTDIGGYTRSSLLHVGGVIGNGNPSIKFTMVDVEPTSPSVDDYQLTEIQHTPNELTVYGSLKILNTRSDPTDVSVWLNSYNQVVVGDAAGLTNGYRMEINQFDPYPIAFYGGVTFANNIYAPNMVNSINGSTGIVGISAGSNITITKSGNTYTIASTASGSGSGFTYAASAPGSPTVGDRWIDSDTGKEYVYINDGSSSQWMEPVSSNGLTGITYDSSTNTIQFNSKITSPNLMSIVFTPLDNQPPASNYATIDTRNGLMVLEFDAATDESAVFVGIMPQTTSLSSGLKIRINWIADTATTGTCRWGAQIERMNTDLDSDSFDTASTAGSTTNATSGIITTTEITITTIDSLAVGEPFRLKIYRDADGTSGTDDMTGDAQLVSVEIRSGA